MPRKIFEFHKHCTQCKTKIPCGLIIGDKVVCPICKNEVNESTQVDVSLDRILYKIRVLLMPGIWMRVGEYSDAWDMQLTKWLDDPNTKYKIEDSYTCLINDNDHHVWISDWPYAYGGSYKFGSERKLPSRATAIRLHDKLDDIQFN